MDKYVKVAIVGAGGVAQSHFDGWNRSGLAKVVGLYDKNPDIAAQKSQKWGVPSYGSVQELISATGAELADICTPEHVHRLSCGEALELGVSVLCEKILAATLSDGYSLVREARKSGKWLGVNYNYHFFPVISALNENVKQGKNGGIHLLNLSTHSFCFHHLLESVIWIFGLPERAHASGVERDWPEAFHKSFRISNDLIYIPGKSFTARLEYPGGVTVNINASYVQSLESLPFGYTAIFNDGSVLEASGLDWANDMLGRLSFLPGCGNVPVHPPQAGIKGNEFSFDASMKRAAQNLLNGLSPESGWENAWDTMVLDHALWLAGTKNEPVRVRELKSELEKELEKELGGDN